MAHMTCLAAARHACCATAAGTWSARAWPALRRSACSPTPTATARSTARSASSASADAIVPLALGADDRVSVEGLKAALAASDAPTVVVLQAGELNLAAFDPFAELAPLARAGGAWTHVDGAFGLWAKASPKLRGLCEGLELCDSWTTDAHSTSTCPTTAAWPSCGTQQPTGRR
jgi:aromatic-L-amino-acid decarboxylase